MCVKKVLLSFCFHPIGETVFWLKLLYQLGLLCFFSFYFWIGDKEFPLV
ncbi:hypothetical protein [uncultured Gammaproteobacteria bacterium]|nr:hypothetical protein [uncultured Gammaproteobacteria bacterium]